ncbi:3-hydroxyacyl-CoA dehydrogenase/enoyl-CoA hydratase/3-hydroxybutyryl-CoA epimerase [Maritalea mobilis]|uniref:enoyl-CoA hydratase n=1 Tax=Maritalea mobilis TaxID=483324 RepID=A0A4R6VTL8_9HYPH|nr:3-hydroxyacyl-CoA dehydrogenase NAD-binding domain-containing protein [Maritalea mobilis]TDQ67433.1 3-hydroxyacyl-CoA dehydrogenase/enoyl-CoA hydratase/3-hydroxybutyryl-CoA epimerase [Maritalea mobilis]
MAQPKMPTLKYWHFEIDVEQIGWLTIDTPKSPVNVLGRDCIEELEKLVLRFEDLAASGELAGVVLLSAKDNGFIAGADVREFDEMSDPSILPAALERTHAIFNKIESLSIPVVAGIHGFCLGGGLELALACHYRIAVNDDGTKLGFPEVKLGIFPGFGGTGRSIRQAGPIAAMTAMLTGKFYRASQAKGLGLVDKLVTHRDQLRWAGRKAVMQRQRAKPASFTKRVMAMGPLRGYTANKMREQTKKKANPKHYPAPHKLIDLYEKYGDDPKAFIKAEIEHFPELMASDTAENLRRVFFLSEGLKAQGVKGEKPTFRRVHVVGAGVMGGDIAAWCALRGMEVTLQDLDMERITPALKRAKKLFQKRLKKSQAVDAAVSRLVADPEGKGVARADVVIEAIVENLEIKQKLFAELEPKMKKDAIMATNTSSIPLEDIASALKQPKRLIGLHFFNPVAQLPLVEVIKQAKNSDAQVRMGASFCTAISKSPVVVKSEKGFLVNRVLMPYMLQAVMRVENGENAEQIDKAAVAFGMPMGPIELMDVVGLDVGKAVAEELGQEVKEGGKFADLVAKGHLGRKTGQGFYKWEDGKAQKGDAAPHANLEGLGRDLVQPLVDECEVCVKEGIVADADMADIGVIFGTGFAPFLGGPLKARRDGKA